MKSVVIRGFISAGLSFLMVILFIAISKYNKSLYASLTNESSGVELLTALFYLIGGVLILYSCIKFKETWLKATLPILLGLFFVFIAGEEESWGQWILGFSTPETLKEVNFQNEVNLHNLDIFTDRLHSNVLLELFIFSYCIVLPIACAISSKIKNITNYFNIPTVPAYLAPAFAIALPYERLTVRVFSYIEEKWRHAEVMEFMFSVFLLVFCIIYFMTKRRAGSHSAESEGAKSVSHTS